MRGWILYDPYEPETRVEAVEIARFVDEADASGIDIRVVHPQDFDLEVTSQNSSSVVVQGEVLPLPDFLIPRLGAATTYFAFVVVRRLEKLGVFSLNPWHSIEAVKDKLYTQQVLAEHKLPFVKTILPKIPVDISLVEERLGFPVIVKTNYGSHGTGVVLAETPHQLQDLTLFIQSSKSCSNIILQEYVSKSHGTDLRVFTIGGNSLAAMKRTSKNGALTANYSRGGDIEPFPLSDEIRTLSGEVSRVFDLDVAGIDLLFDGDHYKICEVNSSPGFQAMEKCHDIDIPKAVYKYIRVRLGLDERRDHAA